MKLNSWNKSIFDLFNKDVIFDFIIFSETFEISYPDFFLIPRYIVTYNKGNFNKNDGVIIYTREIFKYSLKFRIKIVTLNILSNKTKITVNGLYRPQYYNILQKTEFNNSLRTFLEANKNLYNNLLVGDLTINLKSTDSPVLSTDIQGYIKDWKLAEITYF